MSSLSARLGIAISICIFVFILLKGGNKEKMAMGVYVVVSLIGITIFSLMPSPLKFIAFLICDIICLVTFIVLSRDNKHPWPVWAVAFQLNAVVWDVLILFDNTAFTWATSTILYVSGYGVLGAILIGTINNLWPRQGQRLSY